MTAATTSAMIRRDDRRDDRRQDAKPGGSLFGSNRVGGKPDDKSNDKKDDKSSGGLGGLGRGLGGVTSRFGGGDKPADKKDDKPSSGGLGSRLGDLSGRSSDRPGEKKDDKPSGGLGGLGRGLGGVTSGVTSRFGGGKTDDKKDNKPSGGGLGNRLGDLSGRSGSGDRSTQQKKDDKPSGGVGGALGGLRGGLGGVTSRFGGGDKTADKKDNKPSSGGGFGSSSSSSGTTSRFGSGSSSQSTPSYGGSQSSTSRPGAQSGNKPSPLGGVLGRGGKPETSSSARPMPGGSSTRSATGKAGAAPSIGDRLKSINPFAQKQDAKPAARSKTSKAPKVEHTGLSLDNKLDILGVTLLLGSLMLLLSSLSPTKGALTESINHSLSYAFGWGAVIVLLVTFAIGIWLILRHFGDEAPVVSRTRLIGLALLFISALIFAQFINSFQYKVGAGQDYLGALKTVFLPAAYDNGRGGGWIGGEIYFLLISNFSEIGAFVVLLLPLIVGVMLTFSLSASDMAMIVISNVRNLTDTMAQRRQRAAATRAAQQQTLASAVQPQISVSKPVEALPASQSPALPAPVPEPQRHIPITTGGRTSTVPFHSGEAVAEQPLEVVAQDVPVPVSEEKSGLFSRVRGVLPAQRSARWEN